VPTSQSTAFRTFDGLTLRGTLVTPDGAVSAAVVFVHGGGVTRDEGGFFTRIAEGLAKVGVASLRFDLRGHGESDGRQEELTLASILNDIDAALGHVAQETGAELAHLLAASFAGGITAYFAVQHPERVRGLVLVNPLLDYKRRFVDDKPYWHNGRIDEEAGRELAEQGFLFHNPTFKLGRPVLNEVFYLRPHEAVSELAVPALFIHGTRDTFIPVESTRAAVQRIKGDVELLEIEGAQHGIAVFDDPQYLDPQTQVWQAEVVAAIATWVQRELVERTAQRRESSGEFQ
jgi:pimeloyl-ACP methyl ester carboxylesterase